MTEKEKMMQGMPYDAGNLELIQDRKMARNLTYQINQMHPDTATEREQLINDLFGKTGNNHWVEPPFRCDYGYNISVGENFYANFNCTILDCAKVTIGNNVMFAPNVSLFTAGHPIHFEPRIKGIEFAYPITIGDNVWLGGGVIVNPNVTIGENTVIGSGSVVTKDIPANVVAVGNPCKVIRHIEEGEREKYNKDMRI